LNQEQIDKLDELGIEWTLGDRSLTKNHYCSTKNCQSTFWEVMYEQLKFFKQNYGHTRVPNSGEWKRLYLWLHRNKRGKTDGAYLSQQQIQRLDDLGIEWKTARYRSWDASFAKLEAFYGENGHSKVPSKKDRQLYVWLDRQKQRGRGSSTSELTKEQSEKLKSVGVSWE